ncbi:2Fe-2S iron-sulfur cluster-binding protein [Sphingomonas desiccabilis]|uniref:2Fe-2S iron-sulfur cluster binding domain-containing protein n=1 Tax=Sphingomonas desiccabilis TaxID=429134 RepID=A0A4Q2IP89_9SPHN|nr:2Fe-2S iron-sulfur cluster-binding protein [Sphingomonas desiccabilis]MBB3912668.1 xanthine dehydrogenase YagT iron-sulfur-binding subunit [Sphingomonas desiccabilis]RXZ29950.1 2Fe-2S iron-sulfur cluster binding domain-containing protein [Sphingomonas desiccabilis]
MAIRINGTEVAPPEDARVSLLDLLRERLHLTGTKLGCNQGACGACTVLVDGNRVLSCLTLAVQVDGRTVTTIEGLGADGLHPLQAAFLEHDGLQCGYCTPGQICAASAMLAEVEAGVPSYVTRDLSGPVRLSRDEVRERMSGNLCRCGAHNGIVDAILAVAAERAA